MASDRTHTNTPTPDRPRGPSIDEPWGDDSNPAPGPAADVVVSIGAARSRRHFPPPANRRRARTTYGITTAELARAAKVTPKHYQAWERGDATLSAESFDALTRFVRFRAVAGGHVTD